MKILVTGLAATYPFGGVFWDYSQYLLGFHQLGHDVLYVEDTGKWCYHPSSFTFVESGSDNARFLQEQLRKLEPDLADKWFFRDGTGEMFGRSWNDVVDFCRDADLFVHISASCWMREEYFAARKTAFIDSDPMYTQSSVPEYMSGDIDDDGRDRVDMLRAHDVFFTFGENINQQDCLIPAELFNWIPTRQPITLERFASHRVDPPARRQMLTTVASWEPTERGPTVNGRSYSGKSTEFLRFLDLPARCKVPLQIALSGPAPVDRLKQSGWQIIEGLQVSSDPWVYRDYLASSMGEFSIAKNAYVQGRTGWFSCRTACYLALGVPAVVQETGFSKFIPVGEGLFAFANEDEALAGIEAIRTDPERHARAAEQIAREYFASDRVLTRLLADCGC